MVKITVAIARYPNNATEKPLRSIRGANNIESFMVSSDPSCLLKFKCLIFTYYSLLDQCHSGINVVLDLRHKIHVSMMGTVNRTGLARKTQGPAVLGMLANALFSEHLLSMHVLPTTLKQIMWVTKEVLAVEKVVDVCRRWNLGGNPLPLERKI